MRHQKKIVKMTRDKVYRKECMPIYRYDLIDIETTEEKERTIKYRIMKEQIMKYFLDTEFLEGTQKTWFGKTKPTIDLISIGIVAEDGREYYAISKDFNLKEAWDRYDLVRDGLRDMGMTPNYKKVYWLRENILKPIMLELQVQYNKDTGNSLDGREYKDFKYLINKYGKTNKQIAEEIIHFTVFKQKYLPKLIKDNNIQFYAYYADYDWVVFCWLFGKMIDLPKGFPMYCIDLKQELDRKLNQFNRKDFFTAFDFKQEGLEELTLQEKLQHIKYHVNYPEQTNEHNALADARWSKELYEFLKTL